jgi:hypothetical protein
LVTDRQHSAHQARSGLVVGEWRWARGSFGPLLNSGFGIVACACAHDGCKGSGLTGLVDRVEALGGNMTIQSQPGSGTSLLVDIPIESD